MRGNLLSYKSAFRLMLLAPALGILAGLVANSAISHLLLGAAFVVIVIAGVIAVRAILRKDKTTLDR